MRIFHQFFVHFRVPRNIRTGVLFMGTPLMVVLRGVLFFGIKNIYYYIRPLMAISDCFAYGRVPWCFTKPDGVGG